MDFISALSNKENKESEKKWSKMAEKYKINLSLESNENIKFYIESLSEEYILWKYGYSFSEKKELIIGSNDWINFGKKNKWQKIAWLDGFNTFSGKIIIPQSKEWYEF